MEREDLCKKRFLCKRVHELLICTHRLVQYELLHGSFSVEDTVITINTTGGETKGLTLGPIVRCCALEGTHYLIESQDPKVGRMRKDRPL